MNAHDRFMQCHDDWRLGRINNPVSYYNKLEEHFLRIKDPTSAHYAVLESGYKVSRMT